MDQSHQDASISSEFSGISLKEMLPTSNEYRFNYNSGLDTRRPLMQIANQESESNEKMAPKRENFKNLFVVNGKKP